MNIPRLHAFFALVLICPILAAQEESAQPIKRIEGTPTRDPEVALPTVPVQQPEADEAESPTVQPIAEPMVEPVAEPIPEPIAADSGLQIVIELIDDDRVLNGELLDIGDLELQTAFGPASIPLAEVLGIRLARSATDTTTVVLHNGDMVSGQVDIRSLLIQTSWGKSEVNGANLASIYFRKNLSWKSLDLLAGSRWTLVETKDETSSRAKPPRASALAKQ
ncbi:hypothetical protein EC9_47490 [Rosistilla ulvae]|uniref:Uncharacterized protein n=1 Tax=Rosistilla ulvae TaxID=1930277 RepID=A0A517M6Q9_9BACT|nr:hypothetical protein [Rosistilla ulvae]QDS90535.1 hypothetical protein EC9_47490 [Rosistilla ulvae]